MRQGHSCRRAGRSAGFLKKILKDRSANAERLLRRAVIESLELRTLLSAYQVTSLADDDGPGTLRSIITAANSDLNAPITINFNASLTATSPATIDLTQGVLEFSNTHATITVAGPTGGYGLTLDVQSIDSLIYVDPSATLQLSNVTLANGSDYNGGGVINDGTAALTGCTFYNNDATAQGGAIYNDGTAHIKQCSFTGTNTAQDGGAIYNSGHLDVTASAFSGSYASDDGGGLYNDVGGVATLTTCTFAANDCTSYGSAIYNAGELSIQHSTLGANADAGSIGCIDNASDVAAALDNTIVGSEADGQDLIGSFAGNNNLIDDATFSQIGSGSDNVNATSLNLAPLGYYGGPTETMPPLPGSSALGGGYLPTGPYDLPMDVDQRGFDLPASSAPDIGAVQTQSTAATGVDALFVNTLADDPVGAGQMSFQDAINLDSVMGKGYAISFDASLVTQTGSTAALGSLFSITAPLSINESGSDTVSSTSDSALNVIGSSVAWTDGAGNSLSGPAPVSGTDTFSDAQSSELVATVSVEESSGQWLQLPAFVTTVLPLAPTVLTPSVVSPDEIDLNWSDSTAAATEYDLSEYIGGAWVPLDTVPAGTLNYQVTGLAASTSYSFEVAADDGFATSAAASASATTATPPIVTAMGDATIGEGGTYTLSLSANSTGANANVVTGWSVDWGDGILISYSGASQTISLPMTNGWSGLAIVATAETTATSLVPSYPVQADPIYVDTIPTAPTLVTATPFSDTGVTISWHDASATDSNIVILRALAGTTTYTPVITMPSGSGSFTDTSLTASTSYTYEVEAEGGLDGQTVSTAVSTGSVTTFSSALSFSVTPGYFDANNASAQATWSYSGNDVANWELELRDDSAGTNYKLVQQLPSDQFSYNLYPLIPQDGYSVRLRADRNDGTVSDWKTQTVSFIPDVIPTVSAVSYTNSNYGTHSMKVSWGFPDGMDPSDYSVSISYQGTSTAGNGWVPLDTGNDPFGDGFQYFGDTSYVLKNIGDAQSANFRVEINNVDGSGWGYSGTVTQQGTAGPAFNVTMTSNPVNSTVTASWTAGANDAGNYSLAIVDDPYDTPPTATDDFQINNYNSTRYTINVAPGDGVWITVQASQNQPLSGTYVGPAFASKSTTAPGAPLPDSPTNLVATLTDPTHVFLHWLDNSLWETGFDVYRSDDQTFATDVTKITTTGSDDNQYTDTLPNETTTYYYRVYGFSSVAAADNGGYGGLILNQITAGESLFYAAKGPMSGFALHSMEFVAPGAEMRSATAPEQILQDDTPADFGDPYTGPQWIDGKEVAPVAYFRSRKDDMVFPVVTITFAFNGTIIDGQKWYVKGTSDSLTFPWTLLSFANGTASATIESTVALKQVINAVDTKTDWYINTAPSDGNDMGTASAYMYITGAIVTSHYETVIATGCIAAMNDAPGGTANDEKVLKDVAKSFATLKVKHIRIGQPVGNAMTYWGSVCGKGMAGIFDTATLLRKSDGRCGAWTSFFSDVLLDQSVIVYQPDFTIDNYDGVPNVPAKPAGSTAGFFVPLQCQGGLQSTTEQDFSDHQIIAYVAPDKSCEIFDPSYGRDVIDGTVVTAANAYLNRAISAGVKGEWLDSHNVPCSSTFGGLTPENFSLATVMSQFSGNNH